MTIRVYRVEYTTLTNPDRPVVVLCGPQIRQVLAELVEDLVPSLLVLEPDELTGDTDVKNIHTIITAELMQANP